ncbi:glycosyltransferase family 4 protein [Kribbella sp. NPDC056345]|uniref:glycosyltransferase family 4 protein n=1 Tax=Kribbella sp. NPDC056345 TaxID=3345789 RepID=UPI0035E3961D
MRIGLLAPTSASVPPAGYGPIEYMIDVLARGLSEKGHDVILWASRDSQCPVELRGIVPQAKRNRTAGRQKSSRAVDLSHVEYAYRSSDDLDILHDHTLLGPPIGARHTGCPVAVTWHAPFGHAADFDEVYTQAAGLPAVFLSAAHAQTFPFHGDHRIIGNPVDFENFPAGNGDGDYFIFFGRMSPTKGVHLAISAAKSAGVRLLIAGPCTSPDERKYFESAVAPELDSRREYLGAVYGHEKARLLGGARALLAPIQWDEAFGIAVAESLACGTPVLGTSRGSLPELVLAGETGALCDDEEALVVAMHEVGKLSRAACRRYALDHFSPERFVSAYVEFFESILHSRSHR